MTHPLLRFVTPFALFFSIFETTISPRRRSAVHPRTRCEASFGAAEKAHISWRFDLSSAKSMRSFIESIAALSAAASDGAISRTEWLVARTIGQKGGKRLSFD